MIITPPSVPAGIRAPVGEHCLDVRNPKGELIGRVPPAKAGDLIAAGIVSPIGRKGIKYLVLNCDEPSLERPWRGGSRTTERIHNDGGVIIGAPKSGLQHKQLPSKD